MFPNLQKGPRRPPMYILLGVQVGLVATLPQTGMEPEQERFKEDSRQIPKDPFSGSMSGRV